MYKVYAVIIDINWAIIFGLLMRNSKNEKQLFKHVTHLLNTILMYREDGLHSMLPVWKVMMTLSRSQ